MAKVTTRLSDSLSSINLANPTAGTGSGCVEWWWNIFQTLLSAGWTHFASGTGASGTFSTTPGNVNNQITGTGTGAGGLDRNNAWLVLRCPANKRQLLFQRNTAQTQWRVYYSALDTFVGTGFGAISSTVPPSATDQQQILGAAGAYVTMTAPSTTVATRFHCIAYSDAVNTDVYAFYAWATDVGTSNVTSFFALEPLDQFNATDADPLLLILSTAAPLTDTSVITSTTNVWGWYKMNLASEAFVNYLLFSYDVNVGGALIPCQIGSASSGVGPDVINDQAEPSIQLVAGRQASTFASSQGVKGTTKYLRGSGTVYRQWPSRHDPTSTAEARVFLRNFLVPWLANTIPSVGGV